MAYMGKFVSVEYGIHLKDIKEWAESEATIVKYPKEIWRYLGRTIR